MIVAQRSEKDSMGKLVPRRKDFVDLMTLWRELDTRPIEVVYCFLTLGWGFTLLNPHRDIFLTSQSFSVMASIAPAKVWGVFALIVGTTRFYGLLMKCLSCRKFAAFGGMFIWVLASVSLFLADSGTGPTIYGILAGVNANVYIRLCRFKVAIKAPLPVHE